MSESFTPEKALVLRSPESLEKAREYFDLQLHFAEAVAAKTREPIDEAVLKYTNFYRRFGLSSPKNQAGLSWSLYAQGLRTATTHEERLAKTVDFYSKTRPDADESLKNKFGCFSFDLEDDGVVEIHFDNADPYGPLSKERMPERLSDLKEMFTFIKSNHPEARSVKGHSWLYNIEAYRRLFPDEYVASRAISTSTRLDGTSKWGQFLDSEGNIKADLRAQFLSNLREVDPANLNKTFPLQSMRVSAPIESFYKKYGIE